MKKSIAYSRTLPPLLDGGNLEILLGEYHLHKMEWGEARQLLEAGIEKGNLTDPALARKLLRKAIRDMSGERVNKPRVWVADW
ncbi:hypothetical protein [Oceanicoccus sp. KOV_DT_Chl]|uniref:hypothetical protein n=1 Tax=Oceanicoccus sp. KOV_DT_Chl TaxID=1904639 RepID=UPI000C7CAEA6|nr:hypothetical protein [Oceanicoccus sp. KOV_DT_Chl]